MKKVFIAIGVLLVIAGIVIVAIFGGIEGFGSLENPFEHDFSLIDTTEDFPIHNVTDIVVNTDIYTVYVKPTDEENILVKYVKPTDNDVTVSLSYADNKVSVTEHCTRTSFKYFELKKSNNFILIELPKSFSNVQLAITSRVAAVSAEDVQLDFLHCTVDTGGVKLERCKVSVLNAETKTGGIQVKNCDVNNGVLEAKTGGINVEESIFTNFQATANTGAIKVGDYTRIVGDAVCKANTGAVVFKATAGTLNIESKTGSINFDTFCRDITASSDTGSIKGVIQGAKSSYDIDVRKNTGHSNIHSQSVDNGNTLRVEVNTGSINISFTE